MPITGLDDIPSNFTINTWLDFRDDATECHPAGSSGNALPGEGKLRFRCGPGPLSYNDPILYPGQEGAAHLHNFFGNEGVDHNSTYASLRATTSGSADGTCSGGPLNRTGYWFPAMIKPASAGFPVPKVVKPAWIEMYYVDVPNELDDYTPPSGPFTHQTHKIRAFPNGLQMIFGWQHTHPIVAGPAIWKRGAVPGGFSTFAALAAQATTFPTPAYGFYDNITARINSPSCWDGDNLRLAPSNPLLASGTGAGRNHIAYPFQDGNGRFICPSTHPYRIPTLTVILNWSNNGPDDWKHWYISVDRHTGHNMPGGNGFHTDWFGGWDPGIQTIWEEEHLALGTTAADLAVQSSSAGALCRDNTGMKNTMLPTNTVSGWKPSATDAAEIHLPEAYRYADIPTVPGQKRLRLNLTAA